MTPLLLVCSLCLPASSATAGSLTPGLPRLILAEKSSPEEEPGPPPRWESPVLVGAMTGFAVGGNALAATGGFSAGRLALDESFVVVGSLVGIAGVIAGSFVLGPEGGGLLLPLSERKLVTVLLLGGVIGGIGGLAAAEAIGGNLNHPLALLAGAGGFMLTSGVIIALADGIFGLPVWANALAIPLGLAGGTVGGYSLAVPR